MTHSEYNASKTDPVHFLQIWVLPSRRGMPPSYEQKTFTREDKRGRLRLVAAPDGADGSVTLHADAKILAGVLEPGRSARYDLAPSRHAWVQVASGRVRVNERELSAGDGAALTEEQAVELVGIEESEILVFDLA